ncbi:MAG: FG-GAP-like repeat-containing protein [Myxococcota bacterium]
MQSSVWFVAFVFWGCSSATPPQIVVPVGECGDGNVDPGEGCDEGANNGDTAACTATCEVATCGDGLVYQGVEECDDGPANANDAACTDDCVTARCGDGLLQTGVEECDAGTANNDGGRCTAQCTVAVCGDGLILAGIEQCDQGKFNDDNGLCTTQCTLARCGDGFLYGDEACDLGKRNADDAQCTSECNEAVCGDGLIHAGVEVCDDGVLNADDAGCTSSCVPATCGDGLVWSAVEECDDANNEGGDGCGPACTLPRTIPVANADAKLIGENAFAEARVVMPAGDTNNDGLDDVLVTASGADGDSINSGATYLVASPIQGTLDLSAADAVLFGFPAGFMSTIPIAAIGLGDVNNDGSDDFGVNVLGPGGEIVIAYGPIAGEFELRDMPDRILGPELGIARLNLAPIGDVNGDGNADLMVFDGTNNTHIVLGPIIGTTALADSIRLSGENEGDQAGRALAAGDINGDGVTDFIVGASGHDLGGEDAGLVYVVEGPVNGDFDLTNAQGKLVGEAAGHRAGAHLSFAGDINADGFGDIFVDGGGVAYVVYGPVNGVMDLSQADAIFERTSNGSVSGVAAAGDVNGDGYSDLLIGAPLSDDNGVDSGTAYLVLGPVSGTHSLVDADVTFTAEAAGDELSTHLASTGNLDGDGLSDIMLGSLADGDGDRSGISYVFFGSSL